MSRIWLWAALVAVVLMGGGGGLRPAQAAPQEPAANFTWQIRTGCSSVTDGTRYSSAGIDYYSGRSERVVNLATADAEDCKRQGDLYIVALGHRWAKGRSGFNLEAGSFANRDAHNDNGTDTWRYHLGCLAGADYCPINHVGVTAGYIVDGCSPRGSGWTLELAYRW